jgi:hypothetical protein
MSSVPAVLNLYLLCLFSNCAFALSRFRLKRGEAMGYHDVQPTDLNDDSPGFVNVQSD